MIDNGHFDYYQKDIMNMRIIGMYNRLIKMVYDSLILQKGAIVEQTQVEKWLNFFIKNYSLATNNPSILIKL